MQRELTRLARRSEAYVALAEVLDAPLVTTDARSARVPGPTCAVELA